jgi:hypothetical protein
MAATPGVGVEAPAAGVGVELECLQSLLQRSTAATRHIFTVAPSKNGPLL